MVRTASIVIAAAAGAAALLAAPAGAQELGEAGFNRPTRALERSFSAALTARVESKNGCYPREKRLVKVLKSRQGARVNAAVARGVRSGKEKGVVYVLKKGSNCNGVKFTYRFKKVIYLLDSLKGEIRIVGRKLKNRSKAINRGPLRGVRVATRTFQMNVPNRRIRLEVKCPKKTYPVGGGLVQQAPFGPDGEGVYPHSYERLGAQSGYHITAWLFDPDRKVGPNPARSVTLQSVCAKGLAPDSAPHATNFTKPGETKTVVARCPSGQYMFLGGYQRTDFLNSGGNYVTESRALDARSWQVTASAFGKFGGEVTAIAYCVKAGGPLLSEVSASTQVPFFAGATATTPACPPGQLLTSGGFSANGSTTTFWAGGSINPNNTWTASSFGWFGSAALTAYGYCLTPGV